MRSNQKYRRVVHVFVASPSDVQEERECVEETIDEFNRPGGLADQKGLYFEIVDGTYSPGRAMGRPEQVILDQVHIPLCEVFVGILGPRFGSPTGGLNPRTGFPLDSGTQEEFEWAYKALQETGRPEILFYRSDRPVASRPSEIDAEQLAKVNRFFRQFAHDGEHPGLIASFEDLTELQRLLFRDLSRLVDLFAEEPVSEPEEAPVAAPAPARASAPAEPPPPPVSIDGSGPETPPPERPPQDRAPEAMSLLKVDVVEHSRMLERFPSAGRKVLNALHRLVLAICRNLGGIEFSWQGDGGIIGFTGPARQYLAALAGIQVRQALVGFRFDRTDNPLRIPLELRMAAHDGLVHYEDATGSIHSEAINLVAHLEEHGTEAGEFCVTEDLHRALEPDLRRQFAFKGRFEERDLYVFPEPRRECLPDSAGVDDMLNELRAEEVFLVDCLNRGTAHPSRQEIQTLRGGIDKVYDGIQRFQGWFSRVDNRWSVGYLREIDESIDILMDVDEGLVRAFDQRLTSFPAEKGRPIDLLRLFEFLVHRRSWVMALLEQLRLRLRTYTTGPSTPASPREEAAPTREVLDKVARFTDTGDSLEAEGLFAELAVRHRKPLVRMASDPAIDPGFLDRLCERTDLLLVEDLRVDPARRWNGEDALFRTLARNPADPGRFKAIASFLEELEAPTPEGAARRFADLGLAGGAGPLLEQVLWRSLLVAHPKSKVRRGAASHADLTSLWLLLTHPAVPLWVILEAALRFHREADADLQRLFFDCVRARIAAALDTANPQDFDATKSILLVLYSLESLAIPGYWDRLEKINEAFVEGAFRLGRKSDDVESRRTWLSKRRPAQKLVFHKTPAFIQDLPEPVQRYVAGEGCYLDHCVGQKDPIALETFRHLWPQNLPRLLTPRFNPRLLQKLCKEKPFCGEPPVLAKILRHPHCPVGFAHANIRKLPGTALARLGNDREANPEVRSLARLLAQQGR